MVNAMLILQTTLLTTLPNLLLTTKSHHQKYIFYQIQQAKQKQLFVEYETSPFLFFKPCFCCGSRIVQKNNKRNCTKCRMTVKIDSCQNQCFMKILLKTVPDDRLLQLSVFQKEVSLLTSLCGVDINQCNEDRLTDELLSLDDLVIT